MTASGVRSLTVAVTVGVLLSVAALAVSPASGGHIWRGGVLGGIVIGNLLNGLAFCVVAGAIAYYITHGGTENTPSVILWIFFWFLALDGVGHLVGIATVFLPQRAAIWSVVAASVLRVAGAAISIAAAIMLPKAFRQLASEPTKVALRKIIAELQQARSSVEEAAATHPQTELLNEARERLSSIATLVGNLERGVERLADAPL